MAGPFEFLKKDKRYVNMTRDGGRALNLDRIKSVLLHDRGGRFNKGHRPYHVEVLPTGRIVQNFRGNQKAPHAYKMNPYSLSVAYAGNVGAKPTAKALESLKFITNGLRKYNPKWKFESHGQAYNRTKGTTRQASRHGRGLREASWRTAVLANTGSTRPTPVSASAPGVPPAATVQPAVATPVQPGTATPVQPASIGSNPSSAPVQPNSAPIIPNTPPAIQNPAPSSQNGSNPFAAMASAFGGGSQQRPSSGGGPVVDTTATMSPAMRRYAMKLGMGGGAPRNIGEGLAHIGQKVGAGLMGRYLMEQEQAQHRQANAAFGSFADQFSQPAPQPAVVSTPEMSAPGQPITTPGPIMGAASDIHSAAPQATPVAPTPVAATPPPQATVQQAGFDANIAKQLYANEQTRPLAMEMIRAEQARRRPATVDQQLDRDYRRAQIEALKNKRDGSSALDRELKLEKLRQMRGPSAAEAKEQRKVALQQQRQGETAANLQRALENTGNTAFAPEFEKNFDGAMGPVDSGPLGTIAEFAQQPFNDKRVINNQIRAKVAGDAKAVAAAIKPLIRKPGEGAWTDKDQEQLDLIVGDLSEATDKEDFMARLQATRQRISQTFGINIPELSFGQQQKASGGAKADDPLGLF